MKTKGKNMRRAKTKAATKTMGEQFKADLLSLDLSKLPSQTGLVVCPYKPFARCVGPNLSKPGGICGAEVNTYCSRCQKIPYCCRRCRLKDVQRHLESGECEAVEKVEMQIHKDGLVALKAAKNISVGEVIFKEDDLLAFPDTKSSGEELLKAPPCYSCQKTLPSEYNYRCTSCGLSLCGYDCEEPSVHEYECNVLEALNFKAASRGKSITPESLQNEYMDVCILRTLSYFCQAENHEKWKQLNLLASSKRFKRMKSIQKSQNHNPTYKLSMKCTNNNEDLVNRVADLITTYISTHAVQDDDGSRFKALFLLKSSMRQSCSPNTLLRPAHISNSSGVKPREKLVIQANQDISQGSIITFDFNEDGICSKLWSTTMMRLFSSHESIDCHCIRCKDPTELSTYVGSQKCMNCHVGYFLSKEMYSLNDASKRSGPSFELDSDKFQCTFCFKTETHEQLQDILEKIDTNYDRIMNAVDICKLTPLAAFIDYYEYIYLHPSHHAILKAKYDYLALAKTKQFWDCGYEVDQFGTGARVTHWSMKHNEVTPFPMKWNKKVLGEIETRSKYVRDCLVYLNQTEQCCNPVFVHCQQESALTDFILQFHQFALNGYTCKFKDVFSCVQDAISKTKTAEKIYDTFFFRNTIQDFNSILIKKQLRQLEAIKNMLMIEKGAIRGTLNARAFSKEESECVRNVTNAVASGLLRIPLDKFVLRVNNDVGTNTNDDNVSVVDTNTKDNNGSVVDTNTNNHNEEHCSNNSHEMNRQDIKACMMKIGDAIVGTHPTLSSTEAVQQMQSVSIESMKKNGSDGNKRPESDFPVSLSDTEIDSDESDENGTSLLETTSRVEITLRKMLAELEDLPVKENTAGSSLNKFCEEEESLLNKADITNILDTVLKLKEASRPYIPDPDPVKDRSTNKNTALKLTVAKQNALDNDCSAKVETFLTYKDSSTVSASSDTLLARSWGVENREWNRADIDGGQEDQLGYQTRDKDSKIGLEDDRLVAGVGVDTECSETGSNKSFVRNPCTSNAKKSGPLKVYGICNRKRTDSETISVVPKSAVNKFPKSLSSSANHDTSEPDLSADLFRLIEVLDLTLSERHMKLLFENRRRNAPTGTEPSAELTLPEPELTPHEVEINQRRNVPAHTDPYAELTIPELTPHEMEKRRGEITYFFNEHT